MRDTVYIERGRDLTASSDARAGVCVSSSAAACCDIALIPARCTHTNTHIHTHTHTNTHTHTQSDIYISYIAIYLYIYIFI